MDTAGFLTRDPLLWHVAAQALYGTNISSTNFKSFPKKILTSGFPTQATTEGQQLLLDFLAKLQAFLGATNTTALNLNTLWASTPPAAAANPSISSFMSNVYPVLIGAQQFTEYVPPYFDRATTYDTALLSTSIPTSTSTLRSNETDIPTLGSLSLSIPTTQQPMMGVVHSSTPSH
jgi:hypothetical protein